MIFPYLALLGRIVMLGYERIAVKKIGDNAESVGGAFLFFATASICILPFVFLGEMPKNVGFMKYAIASSFVYSFAFWLYVKSLSIGEASLVSPLYNFNVFFLLLLTVTFLDETFSIFKIFGLMLLIYGASFLNRKINIFRSLQSLFMDKACLYMLGASVLLAIGRTIDGFVVQRIDPIIYTFVIYALISLFLLSYHIPTNSFRKTYILFRRKPGICFIGGAVNVYSYLLLLYSYQAIEVSIAEPASMLSMVVTVVLAGRIFRENIRQRLIGVSIMVAGTWLLFL
jgi:transporter family protein